MCAILEKLGKHTYRLEHSPNCPSQYLVRLVGWGKGKIDGEPIWHPLMQKSTVQTEDAYGYGKTLEAAAEAAFAMKEAQQKKKTALTVA